MNKENCVICGHQLGGQVKVSMNKLCTTVLKETLKLMPDKADFKDEGHNPMPIAPSWTKCCFDCNYKYVVPIRVGEIPDNIKADTFVSRPLIITLWTATGLYNEGKLYNAPFYLPEVGTDTKYERLVKREKREQRSAQGINNFAEGGRI